MAAPYDIQQYLLDRANIHDTIFRMAYSFDLKSTPTLISSVYAPKVHIDYTQLLGGSPETVTSEAFAKSLEPVLGQYEGTQHTVQDLLIELPQPNSKNTHSRPDTCTVIAYANAWLYRKDSEGRPRAMVNRNGGRYNLELTRLKDLEEKGENPWRVSKQKVMLSWQDSNDDVPKA